MITLYSDDFSAIQGMDSVKELHIPDDGNCKLPCVCGEGDFNFYPHILAIKSGRVNGVMRCQYCGRTVSYMSHQDE